MKLLAFVIAVGMALVAPAAFASSLTISLQPASANPAMPRMGDNLSFHSIIRNAGPTSVDGVIAWISLVQVDKGNEQPVDLEDWSAHKAVTAADVRPGAIIETEWPIRLIQAGDYRVVISAASRSGSELTTSPFANFTVRQKPVVESLRVLPVALGIPFLLGAALVWRLRVTRKKAEGARVGARTRTRSVPARRSGWKSSSQGRSAACRVSGEIREA